MAVPIVFSLRALKKKRSFYPPFLRFLSFKSGEIKKWLCFSFNVFLLRSFFTFVFLVCALFLKGVVFFVLRAPFLFKDNFFWRPFRRPFFALRCCFFALNFILPNCRGLNFSKIFVDIFFSSGTFCYFDGWIQFYMGKNRAHFWQWFQWFSLDGVIIKGNCFIFHHVRILTNMWEVEPWGRVTLNTKAANW